MYNRMNRLYSIIGMAALVSLSATQQEDNRHSQPNEFTNETPALIMGIMIDQLRPEYISRYWDHLGDNGFKRIVNEGFTFTNAHFNYMPTSTGPGHAAVWTGSTPSVNGVMGNSWHAPQRCIAKVESTGKGLNVRYIVSNLPEKTARQIYFDVYVSTCLARFMA